jgi:polyisoprenoid-binding protein YceI
MDNRRPRSRRSHSRHAEHVARGVGRRSRDLPDDDRRQLRCEDDGAHRIGDGQRARVAGIRRDLTVDLRTLDTGIGLRNEHLRENYLEVDKGPGFETATLSEIDLNGFNADAPEGKGSFAGLLTLHGVRKTVTGTVDVRQAGAGLRVKAAFPVDLSEYSIRKPRYLGIGVKDAVQVEVAFGISR